MQFIERTKPWSSERLKNMANFDLRMVESGRGILLPLSRGEIDRVRRVEVRQIVLGRRYFPVRAPAAMLCSCAISRDRFIVVGWCLYDIMTGNVYAIPARRSKQERVCPGAVPNTRVGPSILEGKDRIKSATKRVQRETDLAIAEKHRKQTGPGWKGRRRLV